MCARCDNVSDAALDLAKSLEPLFIACVRAYLSRAEANVYYDEPPHGLTRTEAKLFSVLYNAMPQPVSFETIFYSLGGIITRQTSLKATISHMRGRLPDYKIKYVAGVGYKLEFVNAA